MSSKKGDVLLILLLHLAVILVLLVTIRPVSSAEKTKIVYAPGFVSGILDFQKALGRHLKEFDIEVEYIPVTGGADPASAVAAGRADFSFSSVSPVINVALQKAPIKVINVVSFEDKDHRVTVVAGRKEIKDWKGLKGKIMGTHRLGSLSEIVARVLLKANGLNPGEDITILELPFAGMGPALKRNQVQALAFFAPGVAEIYNEGYGHELGTTADVIPNLAYVIWFANSDFVARNRPLSLRLMKASFLAAMDLAKMSDQTYISFISDLWKGDKAILQDLAKYKLLRPRSVYDSSGLNEAVAPHVKLMEDFGIIKNVPQGFVDSLVDVSLMEQAYKELRAARRLP